jgi:hypothetical protein
MNVPFCLLSPESTPDPVVFPPRFPSIFCLDNSEKMNVPFFATFLSGASPFPFLLHAGFIPALAPTPLSFVFSCFLVFMLSGCREGGMTTDTGFHDLCEQALFAPKRTETFKTR